MSKPKSTAEKPIKLTSSASDILKSVYGRSFDPVTDEFITQLLMREAKDMKVKADKYGMSAYLKGPERAAPNKQFLTGLLKNTIGYNKAVEKQEQMEKDYKEKKRKEDDTRKRSREHGIHYAGLGEPTRRGRGFRDSKERKKSRLSPTPSPSPSHSSHSDSSPDHHHHHEQPQSSSTSPRRRGALDSDQPTSVSQGPQIATKQRQTKGRGSMFGSSSFLAHQDFENGWGDEEEDVECGPAYPGGARAASRSKSAAADEPDYFYHDTRSRDPTPPLLPVSSEKKKKKHKKKRDSSSESESSDQEDSKKKKKRKKSSKSKSKSKHEHKRKRHSSSSSSNSDSESSESSDESSSNSSDSDRDRRHKKREKKEKKKSKKKDKK